MTTLYKFNNNNRISWWTIEQDGSNYSISWGHDLQTINNPTANFNVYTTESEERAAFEIQSRTNEQLERKGYTDAIPKQMPDLPMLAQQWKDHVTKGRHPFESVSLQPKLDGIRCLATDKQMLSRRATEITSCPHISYILDHLPPEVKLDGELYIPGVDLQTIQSYVRRNFPHKLSHLIEYHIFDIVDLELPFVERHTKLKEIVKNLMLVHAELLEVYQTVPAKLRGKSNLSENCPIKLVTTVKVEQATNDPNFIKTLKAFHEDAVSAGYEGIIIRNNEATYDLNFRSPNLLKYKQNMDSEFKIIDISSGYGATGIFVCETEDGKVFEATPAWTTDRKRWLLRNKEKYIGRYVTVEYEKLSKDGIPLKPIGKCTRESV